MTPQQISELFDKNALYTINSILGAKKLMDKSTFLRLVEEIRRDTLKDFVKTIRDYEINVKYWDSQIEKYLTETKNK